MRYFKLGHPATKNQIKWYIVDEDKVCVSDSDSNFYWLDDSGKQYKSYTYSVEELTIKYGYIETTEEDFNKYLLALKMKK